MNRLTTSQHAPVLDIGIPNPMFEGKLNLYVIAGDPLTLIDTGIGTPEALAAVEAGLAEHGLKLDAVRQVILTHKHADHIGLARDIQERSGARVFIHEDDHDAIVNLDTLHGGFIPLVCSRLTDFGTPSEEVETMATFLGHGKRFAKQVTNAEAIRDGHVFLIDGAPLEVIHTPGHTQGCICLRYGNHLFSGDHVLPGISPNIGAGELRRSGMMQRFLDALDRVAALQTDDLVALPGHGPRFSNLAERCAELKAHHGKREQKILDVLRGSNPLTVYEIAKVLWAKLPGYHLALGTAEVNSHLEKLVADGLAQGEAGRFSAV